MPTYVGLFNFTEQGIKNVKQSPDRLDAAKAAAAGLGGELSAFYLTMGVHDIVAITEFPDDEAAARFALALGRGGYVRGNTLKAFTEAEYRKIVADLP